jgi:hypothetical protein
MPFEYSCFISYRHCKNQLGKRIINEFYDALSGELELMTDKAAFLDKDRLEAGYFYNEELAKSLCKSVCLIMIFTPTYFDIDHTYCAREYKAMEKLEEERLRLLDNQNGQTHGLIIPIVFRGEGYLPPEIKNRRQYEKFDSFLLSDDEMGKHPLFASKIRKIAEYIAERCGAFESVSEDPCKDCSGFALPTEDDVRDFLEGIKQYRQAFPGRGVT